MPMGKLAIDLCHVSSEELDHLADSMRLPKHARCGMPQLATRRRYRGVQSPPDRSTLTHTSSLRTHCCFRAHQAGGEPDKRHCYLAGMLCSSSAFLAWYRRAQAFLAAFFHVPYMTTLARTSGVNGDRGRAEARMRALLEDAWPSNVGCLTGNALSTRTTRRAQSG
ncbi:hypothetical protein L1887_55636 [Cichorium endivia]|nr:hypothetical protein L1887_55636 [Cichorium endivia]